MRYSIDEWTEPTLVDREDNLDQVFLLNRVSYRPGGNWIVTGVTAELLDDCASCIITAP
jgi:hypothetical protein